MVALRPVANLGGALQHFQCPFAILEVQEMIAEPEQRVHELWRTLVVTWEYDELLYVSIAPTPVRRVATTDSKQESSVLYN